MYKCNVVVAKVIISAFSRCLIANIGIVVSIVEHYHTKLVCTTTVKTGRNCNINSSFEIAFHCLVNNVSKAVSVLVPFTNIGCNIKCTVRYVNIFGVNRVKHLPYICVECTIIKFVRHRNLKFARNKVYGVFLSLMYAFAANNNTVTVNILCNGSINTVGCGNGNFCFVYVAHNFIGINCLIVSGQRNAVYKNIGSIGINGIFSNRNKTSFVCKDYTVNVLCTVVVYGNKCGRVVFGCLLNGNGNVAACCCRNSGQ